jgi:hypothetical protein
MPLHASAYPPAPPGDRYVATLLDHATALVAENPVQNAMHP